MTLSRHFVDDGIFQKSLYRLAADPTIAGSAAPV